MAFRLHLTVWMQHPSSPRQLRMELNGQRELCLSRYFLRALQSAKSDCQLAQRVASQATPNGSSGFKPTAAGPSPASIPALTKRLSRIRVKPEPEETTEIPTGWQKEPANEKVPSPIFYEFQAYLIVMTSRFSSKRQELSVVASQRERRKPLSQSLRLRWPLPHYRCPSLPQRSLLSLLPLPLQCVLQHRPLRPPPHLSRSGSPA